jgi:hypothetical protein
LPGRLQRLQATQNEDVGPVNCIRLFDIENVRCPLSRLLAAPVNFTLSFGRFIVNGFVS